MDRIPSDRICENPFVLVIMHYLCLVFLLTKGQRGEDDMDFDFIY